MTTKLALSCKESVIDESLLDYFNRQLLCFSQVYSVEELKEHQGEKVLLFQEGDTVIGYSIVYPTTKPLLKCSHLEDQVEAIHWLPFHQQENIYYLEVLEILPHYQNKGYGKEAFEFICNLYPKTNIVLRTTSDSQNFWHKQGFKKIHPQYSILYQK